MVGVAMRDEASECMNESVWLVVWYGFEMRQDEMKTQRASQRQHHCALL